MSEETNTENKTKIEQAYRIKCPKHMKMPKSVKTFAALGPFKTKEEHNHYMRSTGLAIHEAEHRKRKVYATKMVSDSASRATSDVDAKDE
jgi:hypothetical protein